MAGHHLKSYPAYVDGVRVGDGSKFPETPVLTGFLAPARFEGDIEELEVIGQIPKSINGTYYNVQVDKRFPPKFENDLLFNGDGVVSSFRIFDGHVDWKRRWVRTDRFKAEAGARKSLFGRYRNPYTDDKEVSGVVRTVANTNILFWRGALLALKEDGPPFALDPETLETLGRYDFEGQVLSPTFTAHPKVDPDTGELITFGYEAGGNGNDGSREIVVYTIGSDGKKKEEVWYEAPFCGYIHDFAFTANWIIFPMTPLKCDPERLRKGENHWYWDPKEDHYWGIAPRRNAKREDIVWIKSDNSFQGHIATAYEESNKLVLDLSMADDNVFFWFPEKHVSVNDSPPPNKFESPMTRFEFDINKLTSGSRVEPAQKLDFSAEFARIDDRFQGKYYTQFWILEIDMKRPYDFAKCGPPPGGLMNVLRHHNWKTGKSTSYYAGPTTTFQEPCFVPASDNSPEGDGYIVVLLNRLDELRNDMAILKAQAIDEGPIAIIKLPLRPRLGFHGNFIDHREIKEYAERRKNGDVGPVKAAEKPLPWQLKK